MFKGLLIVLELRESDIKTSVKTWNIVEENPLVRNSVVEAVLDGTDKSSGRRKRRRRMRSRRNPKHRNLNYHTKLL